MEIVQVVKKLNSISRERLNFRRRPILCSAKPALSDHPTVQEKVAVIDRWFLKQGSLNSGWFFEALLNSNGRHGTHAYDQRNNKSRRLGASGGLVWWFSRKRALWWLRMWGQSKDFSCFWSLNPFTATGRIYTSPKRPSRWPRTYIYVPPQFRFYAFVKARPPAWLLLHVSEVSSSSVRWSLLALLGLFYWENSSSMLRAVFVQMAGNSVVAVPRCDR